MVHYSVLIPQRDASRDVAEQLQDLGPALASLILPYEILCIDDASSPKHAATLHGLLGRCPGLRILAFDQPRGTSAALSAGIAAARGDLILALAPHTPRAARWLPHLIARLSQCDFVFARHQMLFSQMPRTALRRWSRLLVTAPDISTDEDLLWGARREAVAGLGLARGAFRLLPALVAQRGYRVNCLTLAPDRPPQGATHANRIGRRLLTRWLNRRYEPHLACEWVAGPSGRSATMPTRIDALRTRHVPQPATARTDEDRGPAT